MKVNPNRVKIIRLNAEPLLKLLQGKTVASGLPDDAVVLRVFQDDRRQEILTGGAIALVIASEAFPEISEGHAIPDLEVLCHGRRA